LKGVGALKAEQPPIVGLLLAGLVGLVGVLPTVVASGPVRADVPVAPIMANVPAFDPLPPGVDSQIRTLGSVGERYVNGRSWHVGCPAPLSDLRVVMVRYVNYDGDDAQGPLVVHRDHALKIAKAMESLRNNGFRIAQIRPVDEYEADDDKSTLANNTSAFNCRNAYGTSHWSQHAFGAAIDINPVQNPYVPPNGRVIDPDAAPYIDRNSERNTSAPGFIAKNSVVVKTFASIGWRWGGVWNRTKDYQHFSSNGR
jgi:D-alanyl-D-alanine carboxypeptidase